MPFSTPQPLTQRLRLYWSSLICLALCGLSTAAAAQAACSSKALVSGFFSNNVQIYNACTGAFERTLDDAGRIQGAQATRIVAGKLYVVSEGNDRILRYNASTFAYEGVAITLPNGFGGTGLAIRGDEAYVAGYSTSSVNRYSLSSGQFLSVAVAPFAAGLRGADNGAVFGPDGKLYVPGYDSNNVIRFDPATGVSSLFINGITSQLFEPRGILFEPGNQTVLVSSEARGEVQQFNANTGSFIKRLITGLARPTGLSYDNDGNLLVAQQTGVSKYDPNTGASRGSLLVASATGLNGPTFVTVTPAQAVIDSSQVGTQFWIGGVGQISGNSVIFDPMFSATGTAFGSDFDPLQVVRKPWGKLQIDWTSCTEARLSWDSTGAGSAGFGSGGYPLVRLGESEQTVECKQVGFANSPQLKFIGGHWYGGEARSGEGLLVDRLVDGRAFVAWFTYRPR